MTPVLRAALLPLAPLRRIASLALGLGALALNLSAADSASRAQPLRVGVTPIFPPMVFEQQGELAGVEPDFARAFARELNRPLEFRKLRWSDQIPALQDGRIDIIMSCMSATRIRQARIAFSEPYLRTGQMALVRRDDYYLYALGFPTRFPGPIGVMADTTGDFLVQQEFPNAARKTFRSGEEAAQMLSRKKLALFISDAPMVWWLAGGRSGEDLKPLPVLLSDELLAWGLRPADQELLTAANRFLEGLKARGELESIIRRWVPGIQFPAPPAAASPRPAATP